MPPTSRRDRITLVLIVAAAAVLRIWWADALSHNPAWSDPDGYREMSRLLVGNHGWRWTPRAVQFAEFTKAPLYQVLLSVFWRFDAAVPFTNGALAAHALLNASSCAAMFVIGSRLHTRRSGLIAAVVYALWLPNVMPTATFWQEQLFIPAVCWAMAGTAVAMETRRPRHWVTAGALFAVAALTRSSITYFVIPAACVVALSARPRAQAMREAALLAGGFALLALPYVVYISTVTGRLTFVESIGYFSLKHFDSVSPADPRINLLTMLHDPAGPPTTGEVLRFLGRDFAASPGAFVLRRLDFVRLLLKPGGGSYLAGRFVATAGEASMLRVAVHAALDVPFVLALVLAPFGAALARRRRLAAVLMLWPPILMAMVALVLWAGTRFRAPAEPVLLALMAVVLAGEWRRPGRVALTLAAGASLVVAGLIAVSVPSVMIPRAGYGVSAAPSPESDTPFTGAMGAYVDSKGTALVISLQSAGAAPIAVTVRVDGKTADAFTFAGSAHRRYTFDTPRRVYLEVAATEAGRPAPVVLRLE